MNNSVENEKLKKVKIWLIVIQIILSVAVFVIFGFCFIEEDVWYISGWIYEFSFLYGLLALIIFNLICLVFWGIYVMQGAKAENNKYKDVRSILRSNLLKETSSSYSVFVKNTDDSNEALAGIIGLDEYTLQDLLLSELVENKIKQGIWCNIYKKDNQLIFSLSDNNSMAILNQIDLQHINRYIIPIAVIDHYTVTGEKYMVSNVEGGGVSVGGAVAGGLLAGGVGALLGGRKKISTKIQEVDDRQTELFFKSNNKTKCFIMNYEACEILNKLIPEKNEKNQNKSVVKQSSAEELSKYYELLQKGIITQKEFDKIKSDLIGN
mgnify:CR=1 FL=1